MISSNVHLPDVEAVNVGFHSQPAGWVACELYPGLVKDLALYLLGGVFDLPAVVRVVLLVEVAEAALEVWVIGSPYVLAGGSVACAGRGVDRLYQRSVVVNRLTEHRLHQHVHGVRNAARKPYAGVGAVLVAELDVGVRGYCLRLYRLRRKGVTYFVLGHSSDYFECCAGNRTSVRLDGQYLAGGVAVREFVRLYLVGLVVVCGVYRRDIVRVHRDPAQLACCGRCRGGRACGRSRGGRRGRRGRGSCLRSCCVYRRGGRHCRGFLRVLTRTDYFLALNGFGGRLQGGIVLAEDLAGRVLRLGEFVVQSAVCTHHHLVGERQRRHVEQIYLDYAVSGFVRHQEVEGTLT